MEAYFKGWRENVNCERMKPDLSPVIDVELTASLSAVLPGARIEATSLPLSPEISLFLLNSDYPQHQLLPEQMFYLMENPLYWTFCWASGQVLAQYLLENRALVAGRRVLDFGCGSGVVGIAAALAGAQRVVACDIDPCALHATARNATLNGVEMELADDFADVLGEIDLIIVADVLYDLENLPWLQRFLSRASGVLMADSRIKDFNMPPYRRIQQSEASTLPDLDESQEFRQVSIYLAGTGFSA
ncbi:MAG: 50S ribosomal protein L11 methyltransferase [Halioglobus sp.]